MNRKLVSGTLCALAALALAAGGSTLAAFDGVSDVPENSATAGVLQLRLGQRVPLTFTDLVPGDQVDRRLWVVGNAHTSDVGATLALTVDHVVDTAAPCDTSTGKALGELASGIAGCAVGDDGVVSGTPVEGAASRLLDVGVGYDASADGPADCARTDVPASSLLPLSGPGDLHALAAAAHGRGTTVSVVGTDGRPRTLSPGDGVCLVVTVRFSAGLDCRRRGVARAPGRRCRAG